MFPLTKRKRMITDSSLDFSRMSLVRAETDNAPRFPRLCAENGIGDSLQPLKEMACCEILLKIYRNKLIDYPC